MFGDFDYASAMINTCYGLGFCYAEQEDFERACHYLSWVGECGNRRVFTEWINCLVNSNHPEAFSVLSRYTDQPDRLRELLGEDAPVEEVNEFLLRRLAYVYAENDYLELARDLLNRLKEMPSSRDFAIGELKYLNQDWWRRKSCFQSARIHRGKHSDNGA